MADISEVISLGIGTPADIPHFILVGLSPNGTAAVGAITGGASVAGIGQAVTQGIGAITAGAIVLGLAPGASTVSAAGAIVVQGAVAGVGQSSAASAGLIASLVTVTSTSPILVTTQPQDFFMVLPEDRWFVVKGRAA